MPKLHIFKTCQRVTAPSGPDRCVLKHIARQGGLVLALFLLLSACAPKTPPKPPAPPPSPVLPAPVAPAAEIDSGEKRFTNAEKRFEDKSYPQALENYHEYLKRFPAGPFADKAWSRLGEIYMRLDDFQKSRDAYARLFTDYPDSPFAAEARIEWLATYYNQGQYEKLTQQAADVNDALLSETQIIKKYLLLGDAYLAVGLPVDAVVAYAGIFSKVPESEKERIVTRFQVAIQQLNTTEMIYLLGILNDTPPADDLMYELGLNKTENELYDTAVTILTSFVEKFPQHEKAPQAMQLIEEIKTKYIFDKNAIGCLLPLSGRYQIYGNRALKAIELALVEYNLKYNTPSLKIIVKDTGADEAQTISAVEELHQEKVAAIVGPLSHVEAAARKAQELGLPIITLTQKDDIPEIGDYVFRNFITSQMQVRSLVSYTVRDLGLSRFAILYPQERYGKTFMNLFWDEVIAFGGTVVGVEAYKLGATDFADPIKRMVGLYYELPEQLKNPIDLIAEELVRKVVDEDETKSVPNRRGKEPEPEAIVDFEAVFIPDSPKKAGLIIPQLAFYDVNDVYLLGTNIWNSEDLIKMAEQYIQGAIIPDGFFGGSASPHVKDFVKTFKETFNHVPEFMEAIAYDTATILFQLTNHPGIQSRRAYKDALKSLKDFQGLTGLTSFVDNGDVQKNLYLLRVRGDQFVEVKEKGSSPD